MYRKRLSNDVEAVLEALAPYQDEISGLVVESMYNWYWLVDALMEAGYEMHLANTAAIVQTDRKSKPPCTSRLARGRRLAGVGCGVNAQLRG